MKTTVISTFAAAIAGLAGAAQFSFEGRWLSGGIPKANVATTCDIRFYSSENASSAKKTLSSVALKTDSDGYFVLSCESPSDMPDLFWVGITPQGGSEIAPRTKVAPVPFALSAVNAELVTDENLIELTGAATIESVEVSNDVLAHQLTLPMGSELNVSNLKASNVYVDTITLGDCCQFGLFNAGIGATLTPVYDAVSSTIEIPAKVTTFKSGLLGINTNYRDGSAHCNVKAAEDGFAIFVVKSENKSCPYGQLSISTADATLVDNLHFHAETRVITAPCRKGETFAISMLAKSLENSTTLWTVDDNYIGTINVKVLFVSFGL